MRYLNAKAPAVGEDRKIYSTVDSSASAGQTIFNVSYDQGRVAVFLNGIRLVPVQDYTYTLSGIGTNITIASGIVANDYVELIGYQGIYTGNALTEDIFVVGTASTGSGGGYTNSTTVFPVSSSTGDLVSVWRNGIKLVPTTDFTVNASASTVTLQSASNTADEITVHVIGILQHNNFVNVAGGTFTGEVVVPTLKLSSNVIKASDGGSTITLDASDNVTIAGNATVDGNLTVSGTTTTINTTITASDAMVVNNAGSDVGLKINSTSSGHIMQLQDNGTDVMVVKDGGNVGIGAASPSVKLHVYDSADHARLSVQCANSSGRHWQFQSRNDGLFWIRDDTAGANRMVFDSSGNVGIGTASPNTALHLKFTDNTTQASDLSSLTHSSGIYINNESTTTNSHSSIGFRSNNTDGSIGLVYGGTANQGNLAFSIEGSEHMVIDHNGKVGINETSPWTTSHITASNNIASLAIEAQSPDSLTDPARIVFSSSSSTGYFNSGIGGIRDAANNGSGALVFYTSGSNVTSHANLSERIRITYDGKVGVGITSPATLLQIASNEAAQAYFTTSQSGLVIGSNTSLTEGLALWHRGNGNDYIGSLYDNASAGIHFVTRASSSSNHKVPLSVINENVALNTGNLVFGAAGKGIDFSNASGSGSGSSSALLDDYEEGTWSAAMDTTGTGFSTSGRGGGGHYTKIGNMVTAFCDISIQNPTGGTGNFIVSGLPFPAKSGFYSTSHQVRWGRVNFPATFGSICGYLGAGNSYIEFLINYDSAANGQMTAGDLNGLTTPYMALAISYQAT